MELHWLRSLRPGSVSVEVSEEKRSQRQLSTTAEKEQQSSFHFPLSVVLNVDKSPREPFRDTVHHQEGLGCQSFLLWQTAVCVWLWGLIFFIPGICIYFFFLFASTLNHSGSYLWGWNNIRSDVLTVLQFPGSQNMGDRTDLTVFFATQIVPRGGKGRSPLKYIIRNNEIFRFRRSFWKVLIQGWEPKADDNSFPGSIHLTGCSPSFVRHPGLHCCCLHPKSTLEGASYGMDFHISGKMWGICALWNCLRAASVWISRRIHCLLILA